MEAVGAGAVYAVAAVRADHVHGADGLWRQRLKPARADAPRRSAHRAPHICQPVSADPTERSSRGAGERVRASSSSRPSTVAPDLRPARSSTMVTRPVRPIRQPHLLAGQAGRRWWRPPAEAGAGGAPTPRPPPPGPGHAAPATATGRAPLRASAKLMPAPATTRRSRPSSCRCQCSWLQHDLFDP